MCGIAGYVHFGQGRHSEDLPAAFIRALRHRGPDEDGMWSGPEGALAMARLSVQDPEAGHQPYVSRCGRIRAVFNGEIYNFREHLDRFAAEGGTFPSRADGEVLIPLYERYGLQMFEHLSGMYAFALLDVKAGRLLLGRDPMGVKPLFYAEVPGGAVFASEVRAILASGLIPTEIDRVGLQAYLMFDGVTAPRTLYQGIRQLPGGAALVVEEGKGLRLFEHWTPPPPVTEGKRDPVEVRDELWAHLRTATRRRLVADVPVGLFLSGGLDSTAVALAALEEAPQLASFFVAVKGVPGFDDSHVLDDLEKVIHQRPNVIEFRLEDIEPALLEVSGKLDLPLGDASLLPTYALCRAARREVTVALSGDGADEVLGGYPTYAAHRLYQRFQPYWPVLKPLVEKLLAYWPASTGNLRPDYLLRRFFDGVGQPDLVHRHAQWMGNWHEDDIRDLTGAAPPGLLQLAPEVRAALFESADPVRPAMMMDQRLYLQDVLLVKADRASMLNGLEVRSPFLDKDLVAWAAKAPPANLLDGSSGKKPLRDVLRQQGAERLAGLPKKGFGIPVAAWLKQSGWRLLGELLRDGAAVREGWINPVPALNALSEHLSGKRDRRKELYTLLALATWVEAGAGRPR